jgi:predicted kinase|tara:strand:+ start:30153 stop:31454 length:1302 start_codon:yes stop_codon:yes gene_type:complete
MKSFKKLFEAKDEKVVFTFGRFNPPTVGHGKLIDALKKASSGGYAPLVYMSHSQDSKKNPLDYRTKFKWMKKFFGKKVGIVNSNSRQVFQIVTELYSRGCRDVRMVVGSDRVREFDTLIRKYNGSKGKHGFYNFDNIQIISAGERDPDSDDLVSGMSASKMRAAAEEGDYDSFKLGVPSKMMTDQALLYKEVRQGMNIKEEMMPTYMFEDMLNEGVYDPGIFKAVFLMGGPGSGKSTVVDALSLKVLGLKTINSDTHFERLMKDANMSMKMTKTGSGAVNPERDKLRAKGKALAGKQLSIHAPARLGLIFDTTSARASKIERYKKELDKLGYEYKMIFVKTSLELAQRLNSMRARTLPPEILIKEHEMVAKNARSFKKLFGKDFIEILNDDTVKSLESKASRLYGQMLGWTKSFPTNKIALAWKERELTSKKR